MPSDQDNSDGAKTNEFTVLQGKYTQLFIKAQMLENELHELRQSEMKSQKRIKELEEQLQMRHKESEEREKVKLMETEPPVTESSIKEMIKEMIKEVIHDQAQTAPTVQCYNTCHGHKCQCLSLGHNLLAIHQAATNQDHRHQSRSPPPIKITASNQDHRHQSRSPPPCDCSQQTPSGYQLRTPPPRWKDCQQQGTPYNQQNQSLMLPGVTSVCIFHCD